jgi:hypothetical protein
MSHSSLKTKSAESGINLPSKKFKSEESRAQYEEKERILKIIENQNEAEINVNFFNIFIRRVNKLKFCF